MRHWHELRELIRLARECEDQILGEAINRTIYRIILSMTEKAVPPDVYMLGDMFSIAKRLDPTDGLQRQLKTRMDTIATTLLKNWVKLDEAKPWQMHIITAAAEYLNVPVG